MRLLEETVCTIQTDFEVQIDRELSWESALQIVACMWLANGKDLIDGHFKTGKALSELHVYNVKCLGRQNAAGRQTFYSPMHHFPRDSHPHI